MEIEAVQPNGSKYRDRQRKEKKYVDKCWDAQLNTAVGNGICPAKKDCYRGRDSGCRRISIIR